MTLHAHVSPSVHSGPQTIYAVSVAFHFAESAAVKNSAQEASVPILRATALAADFLERNSVHPVGTGLAEKGARLNHRGALF